MAPTPLLIATMLAFASAHSGLPNYSGALPHVEVGLRFNHRALGIDTQGITDLRTGHIGLRADWTPNARGRCLLAHEEVHYLQFINGVLGTPSQNEPLAYEVMALCY